MTRSSKIFWGSLAAIMGLALWLASSGRTYLYGIPSEVLEGLCQARGLVPSQSTSPYIFLNPLGSDILFSASLLQSAAMLLGFVLSWFALRKVWDNPISPTLACGLLFFGSQTMWLSSSHLGYSGLILLKAMAVACVVAAKIPLLAGAVLTLAIGEPESGVYFYLVLCYLAYRRQEAYGPVVTVLSVVGIGSLLPILSGNFLLRPSLTGISLWLLVPIFSLLLCREVREARLGLYVTLAVASVLSGAPELASAICLGDLVVVGLRKKSEEAESDGFVISAPRLVQLLAFGLFIASVLPGEQYLNRQILIPAQKKKIPITQLLAPFSLQSHAAQLESDVWRSKTPFAGMKSRDISLLKDLETPFRVLSPREPAEDRNLSLVYALFAQQALTGWVSPLHLSSSSLTCRNSNKNLIVGNPAILFRDGEKTRLESGPKAPEDVESLPELDLRNVLNLPYRAQTLSEKSGGVYQLRSFQGDEILFFEEAPATLNLSAGPQVYQLSSLKDPKNSREVVINTLRLSLKASNSNQILPSRSLVPLVFKMVNRGDTPITSREIRAINLRVAEGESFSPFEQQLTTDFVLFPKEAISLELTLATPEAEGEYHMTASLQTIDEVEHSLPIEGETKIQTWRRLPPVGTWVEEP